LDEYALVDVVQDGVALGLVEPLDAGGHCAVREDGLEPGNRVGAHLTATIISYNSSFIAN
jgi:hypothetical protein